MISTRVLKEDASIQMNGKMIGMMITARARPKRSDES